MYFRSKVRQKCLIIPISYISRNSGNLFFATEFITIVLGKALATMGGETPFGNLEGAPGRSVLVVRGDGGFMMDCQELETVLEHDSNILS